MSGIHTRFAKNTLRDRIGKGMRRSFVILGIVGLTLFRMAPGTRNFAEYVVRTFLLTGSILLLSATSFAQHYAILPVPGSPHGIFAMMQDRHSALWLGTIDDAVRFDGENFYSLRPYGFPKESPNSFTEDSDGGIWIATQGTAMGGGTGHGGLYRYQAGRVTKVFSGDGLSVVSISPGIVLASIGIELVGKPAFGDLILFEKTKDQWTSTKLLDKQANHLTVDHQGNVLFPCPGGWCEISGKNLLKSSGSKTALEIKRNAGSPLTERVLRDRYGCVWFRAEASASYQCSEDAQPRTIPTTVSRYDSSAHLEETPDGSVFMLVRLALGRPNAFQVANATDGIPSDMGTAIIARDGTIWIGADSGLYRFMYPFQLKLWDKSDGIRSPFSILKDGQDIFISSEGIQKLDKGGQKWIPVNGSEGFAANLAVGPQGTLFAASSSSIAQLSRNGRILAKTPILNEDLHFRLATSPGGDVWLGHHGISRISSTQTKLVLHPETVSDKGTADIEYDGPHRTLWACDGNDVVFLKDGRWGRISQKDGLLALPCKTIGIQPNGNLWLGYGAAALSWIGDSASGKPTVRNYTQWLNDLVANSSVKLLSIDSRGWIWRQSEALYLATPASAKAGQWLRLGESSGFSPPPLGGSPFASEPDGSVWLATFSGIAHFSPPKGFATDFPAPPVFIAGYSTGQGGARLADAVGKLPRNTDVVAHVGSLQFDRRDSLHVRYRLLPEQTAWTDTSSLDIRLGRLGSGSHTLQVQGQLATGPWSESETDTFRVLQPLWLTWPVIGGYAVFTGTLLVGGQRWRKKKKERAKRAFPELAEWRLAALSPELHQLDGALLDSRFEVGRILARGGFATITEGVDVHERERRCAIKIFRQELVDKEWMAKRFRHEVLALEQIHHPNVVNIYGSGTTPGGSFYLVMEFIDGQTLRDLLEIGKLAPDRIARYLRQAGSALDEIHHYGICHRDLKPENLMIRSSSSPGEELVLIDFSIAIVKDPDETLHGLSRAAGTIYYMAPEQAIGYADSSTDIYSLAKILIEMLTGERLSVLLPDASMDLPERVQELLSKLPVALTSSSINLVSSALQFDPARRPKNAIDFANQIAADLEQD